MRTAIVFGVVATLAMGGIVYLTMRTAPVTHDDSPAFQELLSDAISRLEGVTQEITSTSVGVAHAEGQQETFSGGPTCFGSPTCDRDRPECWELTYNQQEVTCDPGIATCDATNTCSRFYTCDSQYTCHGEQTCDGTDTCWNSTCDQPDMTCDGISPTCDAACVEYTMQGNFTCDHTPTCDMTCPGWPNCGMSTVYGELTCDRDNPDCFDLTYDQQVPTCDPSIATCDATITCTRYYTCDSQYTCHGEQTCDGEYTCWNSTCDQPDMTCDGQSFTCDGGVDCTPYTYQNNFTCDGSLTCTSTCEGWPNCGQPTVYGQETCDRDDPDCLDLTYVQTVPTCDPGIETCDAAITCSRFYTCDSQYTCHGEQTCDGTDTCWNSTCDQANMTCDGVSETCDGGANCTPYTHQGNYTCDGSQTCHDTCDGWPGCTTSVPGQRGSDRTTWGKIKKDFRK